MLKAIFGSDVTNIDYSYIDYFRTIPWSIKNDQFFSYPSKDGRKVCDVVTYKQENRVDQKGVLRAMSYDVHDRKCRMNNGGNICDENDYMNSHIYETIAATKIIDVDGVPVVMKTIGDNAFGSFWGYGVSCGEYLKEFKQSCNASNGLFVDFGDGCNMNRLSLACASFVPEGKTPDEVLNFYIEGYKIQCLEDSIKYAPYDDENYVYIDPYSDSLYSE